MNHLGPLKRVSDGRWDYTRNSRPTGYCREYEPLKEDGSLFSPEMARNHNERMLPLVGNFHTGGHATEQEACDCYKKYMLDTSLRLTPAEPANASQQNRCKVCDKFTACHAYVGAYQLFVLCPEHQTREHVESLLAVGESWES
jgi:hypothetical protein